MEQQPREINEALPTLESVLCTEELNRRPSRPPDYERENRALVSLAQALANSPHTILQTLADTILEVIPADSAGISLVTEDGERFHWPAIAGVWKPHIGGGTPRDFSPCGDVLDRNCPLLFRHFERRYTYFLPVTPPVEECLLVPFYVEGKAVGTIWAIAHDDRRKFDGEDLRMLVSLGTFASATYQAVEQLHALSEQADERQEAAQAMREMNEALLVSSVRLHELAEQVEKAELHYRRLFEAATDGILILDFSGTIVDANPFMSHLLGYSHGDFIGKELWEIGLFSDKSANEIASRELREKGYIRYENLPLETNHGRQVAVEVVANVYTEDQQGAIQYNIRDITSRRQTEQALARALVYADDIIATLREPFVVLDHELRVKTGNRSFYDSFHVSKEETENRLVYDLGNGQWDVPGLRTLLDEVLSRNQSVHDFEVEHSFTTLGRKTILLNARPFPPDSKHPELILLAMEDVSAVRERADELAEANRRKDEFLAMLSHELRNPLAPIATAVQLLSLQQGSESPIQQQARGIIERQMGQLTRLVDDLMDVSRIATGKVQLRLERVAVSGIVEGAVETVRPLIEERRHELTVSLPPEPICLHADAVRLQQVVANLLTNAAKYTEEGGHVWLTVQHEGNECVLRVRDTGDGITPALMPRIFDLFTQAERSLERSKGGLGIGLALVQRLTELHGGKVEAFSELGHGSEFVVRLPVLPTDMPQPPSPVTETAQPTTRPLRVLVVDDNVDGAKMLRMLLEALGHDVRTAHDGSAALEAALDLRPNLVLLDIGLPRMDGYEVAKRMRQLPVLQDVVLVALTGYGQDSDRQRSRAAGFDHHFVKPADFGKLRQILASVSEQVTRT